MTIHKSCSFFKVAKERKIESFLNLIADSLNLKSPLLFDMRKYTELYKWENIFYL